MPRKAENHPQDSHPPSFLPKCLCPPAITKLRGFTRCHPSARLISRFFALLVVSFHPSQTHSSP